MWQLCIIFDSSTNITLNDLFGAQNFTGTRYAFNIKNFIGNDSKKLVYFIICDIDIIISICDNGV